MEENYLNRTKRVVEVIKKNIFAVSRVAFVLKGNYLNRTKVVYKII